MNDILRQIDDQILDTQLLLEKLKNARDIVYGIVGDGLPAEPERKPAFTVRRVQRKPLTLPKDEAVAARGTMSRALRGIFMASLRKYNGANLNMDQLRTEAFGERKPSRLELKVMHNVLSKLVKEDKIIRVAPGVYSIAEQRKSNEEAVVGTGEQRMPVPA